MHNYTVHKDGTHRGPFSLEEVRAKLADGTFAPEDLAWRPGTPAWLPLAQRLAEDTGEPPALPPNGGESIRPAGVGAPSAQGEKPFNWLVPAILSTIFCCWPVGILAIVYAAIANSKSAAGDVAGADSARKVAKWSTLFSVFSVALLIPIGLFAALAIPAFTKVRNNAIEKTMINDARQISAAANQVMAEKAKESATLSEIRDYAGGSSSGVTLVIDGRDLGPLGSADGKVVLRQTGKFSLRHERYRRGMSANPRLLNQTGPDNQIEFSVETGASVNP